MHLRPTQPYDLASSASGQQKKPDHVGLRPGFPSPKGIERPVKAGDFLARQEPGEPGPGIVLDVPRRVDVEKAPRDGEIQDLAKEVKAAIGSARGGSTVCIEPAPDVHEGNAIQWFRPESWQKSIAKRVPRALLRRRLIAIEMCFLPRTFDEIPEQRGGALGPITPVRAVRRGSSRHGARFAANLLHRSCFDLTKGYSPRTAFRMQQQDKGPRARRSHPDPETGQAEVPDRIFPLTRPKTGDGGIGKRRPASSMPSPSTPTVIRTW